MLFFLLLTFFGIVFYFILLFVDRDDVNGANKKYLTMTIMQIIHSIKLRKF